MKAAVMSNKKSSGRKKYYDIIEFGNLVLTRNRHVFYMILMKLK